jgi:hypothetical protein
MKPKSCSFISSISLAALAASVSGCVLFPYSVSAALVAHDGFQYDTSGGSALSGKGGAGDGWSGAWTGSGTIVADDMAYTGGALSVQGGNQSLKINGTSQGYFARQFQPITGVSEVYFSFLFKSEVGAGADYLNFWLSEDNDRANSAGIGDVTASNRFGVRVFGDDTVINNSVQSTASYTFGAGDVYLLVGRISTDGVSGAAADVFDQIELWVNPTSTSLGGALLTSDVSTLLTTSVGFSFFSLQTSSVGGTDDYRIDEFRVGTDATSVLTSVPEPSTYAMILGGIVLFCGVRRRHVHGGK